MIQKSRADHLYPKIKKAFREEAPTLVPNSPSLLAEEMALQGGPHVACRLRRPGPEVAPRLPTALQHCRMP